MTLRLLAVAAVGALSASVASAEYFCESLPDQDTPHTFRTPLLNADQRTVFAGDVSYACNHSSGGVTYLQRCSSQEQESAFLEKRNRGVSRRLRTAGLP